MSKALPCAALLLALSLPAHAQRIELIVSAAASLTDVLTDLAPEAGQASGARVLLSGASLLAVGNPDSVPAGRYAMEALESYGLADAVREKLVLGGSVREVLHYVASGNAPLGIVFLTDAASEEPRGMVRRLFVFPQGATRTPIVYPLAVLARTVHPAEAGRLAEFLAGPRAREAFRKAGFLAP